MQGTYSQSDVVGATAHWWTADLRGTSQTGRSLRLAAETAVVTLGTLVTIRFLSLQYLSDLTWLAIPCLLVVAALLPTWLRHETFPPIGPSPGQWTHSLTAVCRAGLWTFPPVLLGLWLVTRLGGSIPLAVAERDNWLPWLIYQFLYVAVAEEMFFRGYVQVNVTRLFARMPLCAPGASRLAGAAISAGCFALAHVAVQGRPDPLLTFLPGLVLAWLFIRTQSLLACILYHGLANVAYSLMATIFP